jgi:hypothetical protein
MIDLSLRGFMALIMTGLDTRIRSQSRADSAIRCPNPIRHSRVPTCFQRSRPVHRRFKPAGKILSFSIELPNLIRGERNPRIKRDERFAYHRASTFIARAILHWMMASPGLSLPKKRCPSERWRLAP